MSGFKSFFDFFSPCRPSLSVSEDRSVLLNLHDGQEHFTCLYKGVSCLSISFVW